MCAKSQATVMVYSSVADSELMIRCMRAGAREFLSLPFPPGAMAEAMVRGVWEVLAGDEPTTSRIVNPEVWDFRRRYHGGGVELTAADPTSWVRNRGRLQRGIPTDGE